MSPVPTKVRTSPHDGRTRLHEVAKLAKVSPITVARTFAANAPVAQETRDRVLRVARQLGYKPNPLARGLRGGRTQSIGILWSLSGPPQSAKFIRDLSALIQQKQYITHIADSPGAPDVCCRVLADCAARSVDGIVLQAEDTEVLAPAVIRQLASFRAVVVVTSKREAVAFDQIVHNRLVAQHQIAEHLVKTGRRRIAYLVSVPHNTRKVQALIEHIKEIGGGHARAEAIDFAQVIARRTPEYLFGIDRTFYRELHPLLDTRLRGGKPDFDALVCSTDEIATVAMAWARSKGLRVPEDVAVTGFNDTDTNEYLNPPLASVDRFEGQLIGTTLQMLFARLDDKTLPVQRADIAMQFIPRASAG